MKRTPSLKLISLFVLVSTICESQLLCQGTFSQTSVLERIIPMTPEAAQFKTFGNFSANNAKGLPDISIPLYEISMDEISVPISLSYNAHGLKVNDITGSYGANWLLHAGGMIYRNIAGRADEIAGIGWFGCYPNCVNLAQSASGWNSSPGQYQQQIMGYPESDIDFMPDPFGYSFGSYSGEFMFSRQGTIANSKRSTLRIEKLDGYDSGEYFIYFKVTDGQGNQYYFGETENSRERNDSKAIDSGGTIPYRSGEGITGWKLSRVVSALGETVYFSYEEYVYSYQVMGSQEYSEYGEESYKYVDWYTGDIHYHPNFNETKLEFDYDCRLISMIQTPYSSARFVYRNIEGTYGWSKALDSLIIFNNQVHDNVVKAYSFDVEKIDSRLFLNSIKELDVSGTKVLSNGYHFQYSGTCPETGSLSQDYFGFNNDCDTNQTLISSPSYIDFGYGGNRRINAGSVSAGTLSVITYPTGGKTVFEFEENQEENRFAAGLRVKRIYEMDEEDQIFSDRRFLYEGLTGYTIYQSQLTDSGFIKSYPLNTLWGTLYVLQSHDPKVKYLDCADYYYETVVESQFRDDTETGRIMTNYQGYVNGDSYVTIPILRTTEKVDGSNRTLLTKERMSYNLDNSDYLSIYIKEDPYFRLLGVETNYYPGFVLKYFHYSFPYLRESKSSEFFNEETDSIARERYLYYNDKGQVVMEENSNVEGLSLGSFIKTTLRKSYIAERLSDSVCLAMYNLNMLDKIVEESHEANGTITSSSLIYYNTYGGLYLPEKILSLKKPYAISPPPAEFVKFNVERYDLINPEIVFSQYSIAGKPLEILTRDGIQTKITWYNNYPILIEKRSIADTTTVLNSITYTYKPLIGITSQTDTNGKTIYYEYDRFGRLKYIRDHNGNILKRIDYNYGR